VLVERDSIGGLILERALATRDMDVTRLETGRALSSRASHDCDALLLVLDDDDSDIFDTLLRVSSQPQRPPVVLMTRRAHARMLEPAVLISLGVDQLVAWPCRVDEVAAALHKASQAHEPLRLVS
jgi:DNA-binding response OmpR family regulator